MMRFAACAACVCALISSVAWAQDRPVADPSTPKGVLVKLWTAVVQKDKPALKECFTGRAEYLKILDGLFAFSAAAFDFRDALVKAYGPDAWETYTTVSVPRAFVPQIPPRDTAWLDGLEIQVDGDKASYVNPWTKRKDELVRKDGKWFVLLSESAGPAQGLRFLYVVGTKVLREGIAEAGKEKKPTLTELKAALGEKFAAALQSLREKEKDKSGKKK